MAHISAIIPVYKNETCLRELYQRLKKSLEAVSRDYEIIMVEDCGGDRSWNIITELAHSNSRVKGIQFSRNFGQHYAITAGLDLCEGDWAVIMDADLQDRPEEISKLYTKAKEGFDVVLARRITRKDRPFKLITSRIFYRIFAYFTDLGYDSRIGNFRIVSRKVVKNFRLMRENLRFFGGLINWMGFPVGYIDVKHEERKGGKSAYTLKKLFKLAGDAIIAYSDKPLRLSVAVGFTMSFLSFAYGSYIILRAIIFKVPATGWTSLIVSLYFIGGIIIGILGIIGVYLGKTFDETKKRPLYIIRRSTDDAKEK